VAQRASLHTKPIKCVCVPCNCNVPVRIFSRDRSRELQDTMITEQKGVEAGVPNMGNWDKLRAGEIGEQGTRTSL